MSTVFYRWGARRDESRVTFDGTHISLFDLKREIILSNKMGNGKDFDLGLYDNVTGEELKDDHAQIPRSSSLIARRLPPSAKGRGTAQTYIAGTIAGDALTGDHRIESHARQAMQDKQLGKGPGTGFGGGIGGRFGSVTKRFDGKDKEGAVAEDVHVTTGDKDEDAKIQAILAQGAETWEQMQEDMAAGYRAPQARAQRTAKPSSSAIAGAATKYDFSIAPDKEPPVGYICYRCGQKGHWIQDCPKNDDPEAGTDRKRFVRVTGIPRSFLKTVESPAGAEGSSAGAMLTADGGFVKAMPDQRQWQKQAAVKPRALTGADVRDQEPLEPELTCPICKKLVWDAVRTPCCDTAFCEECITSQLVDHDFECPHCESKVPSLDKLRPEEDLRRRAKQYVDTQLEKNKAEKAEGDQKDVKDEPDSKAEDEEGAISSERPKPANQILNASGQPVAEDLLNPQMIQTYLMGAKRMLLNPSLNAAAKTLLHNQMQTLQANLVQMQMLAMMGMGMGGGMQGMNGMGGMNGGQGHMGMMGNQFNQQQHNFQQQQLHQQQQQNFAHMNMQNHNQMGNMANMGIQNNHMGGGAGMGMRGRGGFRGGFRGRGGMMGNMQRAPMGPAGMGINRPPQGLKRGADGDLGGDSKQPRVGA
ncbi:hypothetical protein B9479_000282 [Cryptococcus floricola]|uniref:Protein MPE1 n=1 Tax=Cryptococcus floricola TaxID=2591691 RepID=A0A5D3B9D9_9TREE|nr:hypothetical protein B9479_000282 [Cryptococcus floricola]